MLRILIADDHFLIRRGLRQLLEETLPGSEVDESEDGPKTLAKARHNSYDVIVLDISMPQ